MTDQDRRTGPHRRDVIAGAAAATAAALTPIGLATAQPAVPPRNRTMSLVWGGREGRWVDFDLWNPYSIGANHQNGPNIIYEPLAYYSAFADKKLSLAGRELPVQRRTSSSSPSRRAPASTGATASRSAPRTWPTR